MVFQAEYRGAQVAVKKIKADQLSDEMLSDFRKELSLLHKLRFPNILLLIGNYNYNYCKSVNSTRWMYKRT